eukprot:scaffold201023_cov31-Prasinocladus_malaysianus.AAC.1
MGVYNLVAIIHPYYKRLVTQIALKCHRFRQCPQTLINATQVENGDELVLNLNAGALICALWDALGDGWICMYRGTCTQSLFPGPTELQP